MVKRKKVSFKTRFGKVTFKAKIIDKKKKKRLSKHEVLLKEQRLGFIK